MKKDVVIIGGGPAGLMAAYQLEKANVDYVLLEKNSLLGKKLLITGQGRCNVTNHLNTNQFINQLTLPHRKFLYSTLSTFGTAEVVSFFTENKVPLYQDGELKFFPKSNKAIDIRNVFSEEVAKHTSLNTEVKNISIKNSFIVKTNNITYEANKVIVSTGSNSFPKTGSNGIVMKFAKSFGIDTAEFYPAETSVYSSFIQENKESLQGVAIQNSVVSLKNTKHKLKGDLLFTHFGLSGPVIFHLSETIYKELKQGNNTVEISLSNAKESVVVTELENADPKLHIQRFLEQYTIKRLARFLLIFLNLENVKIGTISNKKRGQIIDTLFRFNIKIDAVEDCSNAYVNGGGILVSELNPKTFESKKIPGLYFIGEAVDIHGPIGGFNITIALSSGFSASSHIKKLLKTE